MEHLEDLESIARTTEQIDTLLLAQPYEEKKAFVEGLQKEVKPLDIQPINDLASNIQSYLREHGYYAVDPLLPENDFMVIQGMPALMIGVRAEDYLGDLLIDMPDKEQPSAGFYYKTNWAFLKGTQDAEKKESLDQQTGALVYTLMKKFDVKIDIQN